MTYIKFPYQGITKADFIKKALYWANTYSHFSYFNHNQIPYPHDGFKEILAVGFVEKLDYFTDEGFKSLEALHASLSRIPDHNKSLFGYLGYDLKNELEDLESSHDDHVGFPDIHFYIPKHLLEFGKNELTIKSAEPNLLEKILSVEPKIGNNQFTQAEASVSRDTYLETVERLRGHIEEGDCYEINYCQEFHGQVKSFDPVSAYLRLNDLSPNPFSCLQKFDHFCMISASPERFIKKTGNQIISQPIKGTSPRSTNPNEDIRLKTALRNDEKELAENMMIVDLVRNDLARTALTGSVKVEEMFGIYSFRQVHQMISTITSLVSEETNAINIIKNAFPMGSMTGAPKVKVMQLIEKYENTRRGAFSGATGYITENDDFDFNVLIRSLFINQKKGTYSFQVGSAITYDSVPEKEYEECLIKAKAILELLKEGQAD